MATVNGIDVSVYQKGADFKKIKARGLYTFAILRAGIGTSKDSAFDEHYANATAAGIQVGAYWYSKATTESGIDAEVAALISVLKGKQFAYPIYMDVETNAHFKLGKEKLSALIARFLNALEATGYWAGLYMSKSPLENYTTTEIRNRYAVWVAQYSAKCTYSGQYGMWQHSIAGDRSYDIRRIGAVYGISGACDLDECYVDYPTKIKDKGLNGFAKTESKKTIDEIAREVLDGKWGNGTYRKTKLTKAGYDYTAVQARVTQIMSSTKLKSVTEIAKEVIAGKWGNGTTRKTKLVAAGYDYNAVQKEVNRLMKSK